MNPVRILVAGIGNIFFGDDAFGVEVARRLAREPWPAGVRVVDFGIRGLDLTYALLDCEAAILVDAMARGAPPGTLAVLEPELDDDAPPDAETPFVDPHDLDPAKVLMMVRRLEGRCRRVVVVGCEPERLGSDAEPVGELSETCRAAVEPAASLVRSYVNEWLSTEPSPEGRSPCVA